MSQFLLKLYLSGKRTVSPTEFVTIDLTPEVPVPGEPALVTCTTNVTDVQAITLAFFRQNNGGFYDRCISDIRNNQSHCSYHDKDVSTFN